MNSKSSMPLRETVDWSPIACEPGQFKESGFDDNDLYASRWASHKDIVDVVRAGEYDHLTPKVSEFIPTLQCPYRCPTCAYKSPKEDAGVWNAHSVPHKLVEMEVGQACVYLDKLKAGGCEAILLTGGGEPTFYPHLKEIVTHARDVGLKLAMSTNGTFARDFEPEDVIRFGFEQVRISLNTIEKHAAFHGYNKTQKDWCELVLKNIRRIVEQKKRSPLALTRITICMIFNQDNFSEIPRLGDWIAGVDGIDAVVIRPVLNYFGEKQVSRFIMGRTYQLVKTEFEPLLLQKGIQTFMPVARWFATANARPYSACRACGLIGGLWPNGRIFMCTETNGFDEFCIGNLSTQTVEEIYTGKRFQEVRSRVAQEGFARCPVACRPNDLNCLFESIETLRNQQKKRSIDTWIDALQQEHQESNPWIQI